MNRDEVALNELLQPSQASGPTIEVDQDGTARLPPGEGTPKPGESGDSIKDALRAADADRRKAFEKEQREAASPPGAPQQRTSGPRPRSRRNQPEDFPLPNFRSGREFIAEYKPALNLVDGLMQSTSLYALTGITNHGKTAFFVLLALAVITGNSKLLGRTVRAGRVAFCTAENPDGLRIRLCIAAHCANVDPLLLEHQLIVSDNRVRPEEIHEYLKSTELDFDLVIVDTWQAFFDGEDANNRTDAVDFTRRLRPLTSLPGNPTVIFAAHPNKGASSDELIPSGGGSILNEIDMNLTLYRNVSDIFELHYQDKIRGPDFEPISFRIKQETSPDIVDARGFEIAAPVMRLAEITEVERREQTTAEREMALLRAIRDHPQSSMRECGRIAGLPAGALSRHVRQLAQKGFIKTSAGPITLTGKRALSNGATPPGHASKGPADDPGRARKGPADTPPDEELPL
jgi:hypothetical protein